MKSNKTHLEYFSPPRLHVLNYCMQALNTLGFPSGTALVDLTLQEVHQQFIQRMQEVTENISKVIIGHFQPLEVWL